MRYDYGCSVCGFAQVLNLPMDSSARPRHCPKCGRRSLRRVLDLANCARATIGADAHIPYQNRFPYVSSAFPFKGHLAGAGAHVGPMGKIRVDNAAHEERLRAVHGYVDEKKVG